MHPILFGLATANHCIDTVKMHKTGRNPTQGTMCKFNKGATDTSMMLMGYHTYL